ncbi:MAG: cytochrome c-type biogenesis CcmF C-terminal domain-containing protein, partial [Thermoleophilia bacterium]
VEPHSDIYPVAGAVAQASILGGFGHDLFVVVQDPFDQSSKHLRLQLDLFPLIRLVWIGSLLLVGGAGVSLWPRRQPATVLATAAEEGGEAA